MIVTEITQKGRTETYNVFVDGDFFSQIELEFLYKYRVNVGTEISEEKLKQMKIDSDKLLCSMIALRYLSKRARTEFQTRQYLKKCGFCKEGIDSAVKQLKDYGYVNDVYFATEYAKEISSCKGKRYIRRELELKGVNEEKIESILSELKNEQEACDSVAKKWLKNKPQPLDKTYKEKMIRFLLARGFEYDHIKNSANKLLNGDLDDWD